MPKGVYPRKKKDGSVSTPASYSAPAKKAPAAPKGKLSKAMKAVAKAATPVQVTEIVESVGQGSAGNDILDLHRHIGMLVNARVQLTSGQHDHNPTTVGTIDGELTDSFKAASLWRASRFPTAPAVKPAAPAPVVAEKPSNGVAVAPPPAPIPAPAPIATAPIPVPMPAPVPGALPTAPLPFSPQAVEGMAKGQ